MAARTRSKVARASLDPLLRYWASISRPGQPLIGGIAGHQAGQLRDDGLVLAQGEAGVGPVHLGPTSN